MYVSEFPWEDDIHFSPHLKYFCHTFVNDIITRITTLFEVPLPREGIPKEPDRPLGEVNFPFPSFPDM